MSLLIFDCDGVLIDSEIIADKIITEYISRQFPALDFSDLAMNGILVADILSAAEQQHEIRFSDDAVDTILHHIHQGLETEVQEVHGVSDALAAIPFRKAVASNSTSRYVAVMLQRVGLQDHFQDRIFGADKVAKPKPSPDVYLLAASENQVDPQDCVVVEDSATGTTAAIAAGMTVIGFLGASHATPATADLLQDAGAAQVVFSMADVPAAVQSQFASARSRKSSRS